MGQSGPSKAGQYNVICFGFMPWGNMWKRNQSMMAELAKLTFIRNLIFVNPRISLKNKLGTQVNHIHGKGVVNTILPKRINSKIMVYTPMTWLPCKQYLPKLMKVEDGITLKMIRLLNQNQPYILFLNCPNFSSNLVMDALIKNASLTLFDFSDDFSELGYDKTTQETFRRNSLAYAQKADVVLTVNEHIKKKYVGVNANIHVVRNATNYENFDRPRFDPLEKLEGMKKSGRSIIGYSGIANLSRMDTVILDHIIRQKPTWQLLFVGPAQPDFIERYSRFENVHLWGSVNYDELPRVIRYFDVAIVPFLINDRTKGNDLLKLYDYLALGKPVVSTNIGGAGDLREVIRLADTPSDFFNEVEKALQSEDSDDVEVRKKVARTNSWLYRITEVEALIRGGLEERPASMGAFGGKVSDASYSS